jgi:hypothetical protein
VSQLNLPEYIETESSNLPDIVDGKLGFEITLSRIDYNRIIKNNTSLKDVVSVDVTVTKTNQNGNVETLTVD